MPYVYSTLANDNLYHLYQWSGNGGRNSLEIPRILKSVLIKGGAGIATKHLVTPLGVLTQVSNDELELLLNDEVFQTHLKNGFVKYEKKKIDVEVAVADMEGRDNSAPVVPEDSAPGEPQPVGESEVIEVSKSTERTSGKVKNNLR